MEWPAMSAAFPFQHQYQKGRVFELSEDYFDDSTQNVGSSTQVPGGFHGDFDASIRYGLPQDQELETLFQGLGQAQPPSPTIRESTALAIVSREPSVTPLAQTRYPTTEEWAGIKPVFTKLYISEDRTLKEVQTILEQKHGFSAT
jgi:Clr5 domain